MLDTLNVIKISSVLEIIILVPVSDTKHKKQETITL